MIAKNLVHHERSASNFEDSLRDLTDAGLLSQTPNGNYSVRTSLIETDFLNPSQNGNRLYFSLEDDARDYGELILRGRQFGVVRNGDFEVPGRIESVHWRIIRAKLAEEPDPRAQMINALEAKGIVSPDRKGNWGISSPRRKQYKEIDLGFYFTSRNTADDFAKAFEGIENLKTQRRN